LIIYRYARNELRCVAADSISSTTLPFGHRYRKDGRIADTS